MNGPDNRPVGGRLGEVVRSSSTEFVTQCYELNRSPSMGSLVTCGEVSQIFGVVGEVATESLDTTRPLVPKGRDLDTEAEVYSANPQLSRLLTTRFTSITVGHAEAGSISWRLAPNPPRPLSFVRECTDEELRAFSASVSFLPGLLSSRVGSPDQVTGAFIRHAASAHPDPEEFVVRAGRELAGRLPGQLRRVAAIIGMATR